jgi:hypothetical protein
MSERFAIIWAFMWMGVFLLCFWFGFEAIPRTLGTNPVSALLFFGGDFRGNNNRPDSLDYIPPLTSQDQQKAGD